MPERPGAGDAARQAKSGQDRQPDAAHRPQLADLLAKLEAVRLVCQETGCAQRYLAHDAFSALQQTTARVDAAPGSRYRERFLAWMHDFQDADLESASP